MLYISMNNLLSYCGLVDAKIRASDIDSTVIRIYASISNESRSAFYMTKNDFEVASLGICVGLLFKVQIF